MKLNKVGEVWNTVEPRYFELGLFEVPTINNNNNNNNISFITK